MFCFTASTPRPKLLEVLCTFLTVLGRPKFLVTSESAAGPCCRVTATSPTHFPRISCAVVAHIRNVPRITPPPIGWAVTVSFRPRLKHLATSAREHQIQLFGFSGEERGSIRARSNVIWLVGAQQGLSFTLRTRFCLV